MGNADSQYFVKSDHVRVSPLQISERSRSVMECLQRLVKALPYDETSTFLQTNISERIKQLT